MALSGTLDTFALPDVLRLLATTVKTGRLCVTGERGSGSVWVDDGKIVATELAVPGIAEPTPADVVFGLLRFDTGSFSFENDARPASAGSPADLEPVLVSAEAMLGEWKLIAAVIPSFESFLTLNPDLTGNDIMIDAARWRVIVAVGGGDAVSAIAETLGLSEIELGRSLKELVEVGLVAVGPARSAPAPAAPADTDPAADATSTADPVVEAEPIVESEPEMEAAPAPAASSEDFDPIGEVESAARSAPAFEDSGAFVGAERATPGLAALETEGDGIDPLLPGGDPLEQLTAEAVPAEGDLFAAPSAEEPGEEIDAAEMARQLANLSPKAAKAVAAAAKASTDAERDAALAAVEAEDDRVNRGLLLKFLGSVDN